MKVSTNWLSDYIDISKIDSNKIAKQMEAIGNEVESISKFCEASNLVIGYVKEITKHKDADKLNVCLVDIGEKQVKQIICGALNIAQGQKVVVAKEGAILPNNIKIDKVTIRGVTSEGMICSLEELGIEAKYLREEDKKGIFILPDDAPLGKEALSYLGFDDIIINYELSSNRGDLLSMLGMAYEVGAIFNKEVKLPNSKVKTITEDINDYLSLTVTTDNCPLYMAKMVTDITIKESPLFIKTRLMAAGIRTINNVVDISNYVMLEYGQPLHFFDYDKLKDKIIVRMAQDKEEVITLDNEKRRLDSNDIVIANKDNIVALAGVMGAYNTEVDDKTKTLVIEGAYFNPLHIRHTSKKFFRSEASLRFEKGIDPTKTLMAIKRACYLLNKYATGKTLTGVLAYDNINKEPKQITIDQTNINDTLGMNLSSEIMTDIFKRLGFAVKRKQTTFIVTIPLRRIDINIKEDLIEEVGRMHGYDKMKATLPIVPIKRGLYSLTYEKEKAVRDKLIALGLKQVISYSLVNLEMINTFTNDDFNYVEIINPMSEDKKILRYSLLPSLLKIADYNLARQQKDINIFEIGAIYHQVNNTFKEEKKVAGLLTGNYLTNKWQHKKIEVDFYLVKGLLEALFNYLGILDEITFKKATTMPKEFMVGKTASIWLKGNLIGYLGALHSSINKAPIYLFEFSFAKIDDFKVARLTDKPIIKYPSISQDLAFIFSKDSEAALIIETIKQVGGPLLIGVDVFDYYIGDKLKEDEKSLAFSLEFSSLDKTLTDNEIKPLIDKIVKTLTVTYNAKLRDS